MIKRHTLTIGSLAIAVLAMTTSLQAQETIDFTTSDVVLWALPSDGATANPHAVSSQTATIDVFADADDGIGGTTVNAAIFGLLGTINPDAINPTGVNFATPAAVSGVPAASTNPFDQDPSGISDPGGAGILTLGVVNIQGAAGDAPVNSADGLFAVDLVVDGGVLGGDHTQTGVNHLSATYAIDFQDGDGVFNGILQDDGTDVTGTIGDANLIIYQSLIGDSNGDGVVNNVDILSLSSAIGAQGAVVLPADLGGTLDTFFVADANQDGVVNNVDILPLAGAIGSQTPISLLPVPPAPTAVPEPSSVIMLLLGCLGLVTFNIKRKQSLKK